MNKNYVEDFVTILRFQRYAKSSIKTYTSHLSYFLKLIKELPLCNVH